MVIPQRDQLFDMDVPDNKIANTGAAKLAEALKQMPNLKMLNLASEFGMVGIPRSLEELRWLGWFISINTVLGTPRLVIKHDGSPVLSK